MKFTFSLNGVKTERDVPNGWQQVKFKDFLLLDGSVNKSLSIFTGIDEATLKKAKITGLEKLIQTLSFLTTEVPLFNFPKKLMGQYDVPYDIGFEQWGQYIDLQTELDKGLKGLELIRQYPMLCAIYTMKDYDFKLAEQRAIEIMDAPCTEVMATANFILMKLGALRSSTANNYPQGATVMTKLKLALKTWWINTMFTARFYILKKKLRLTEKS